MNGLRTLELQRPSLSDRLLRRKPKENAAIEVNNYIASTPLEDVTGHDLARILTAHKCDYAEVKPALTVIYTQVLNHFSQDARISGQEQSDLMHLRKVFRLTEAEADALDHAVLLPLYQQAVRDYFADGHFTFREREQVERLARDLGQETAEADALILDEAFNAFERSTKRAAPADKSTTDKKKAP